MYDTAISKISYFIEQYAPDPKRYWTKPCLKENSCVRWAANEILEKIIEESSKPPSYITGVEPLTPLDIVTEFKNEMEYCYDICDGEFCDALLVAIGTAERIECLLI